MVPCWLISSTDQFKLKQSASNNNVLIYTICTQSSLGLKTVNNSFQYTTHCVSQILSNRIHWNGSCKCYNTYFSIFSTKSHKIHLIHFVYVNLTHKYMCHSNSETQNLTFFQFKIQIHHYNSAWLLLFLDFIDCFAFYIRSNRMPIAIKACTP